MNICNTMFINTVIVSQYYELYEIYVYIATQVLFTYTCTNLKNYF